MNVQLGPSSSQAGPYSLSLDPSAAASGRSLASFMPPAHATNETTHFPIAPVAAHSTSAVQPQHATATRKMRKRKADSQDNERLSKRLSLLNLEQNGQKLYVPVESPQLKPTAGSSLKQIPENDHMQLDESKHKVYIYDLDAELSDGESSSDEGKLLFLPDIAKHLHQQSRIPPRVLANGDGELAGMQLVLYSEPKSLTVPEEQDSVRKAIVEARARIRRKQNGENTDEVVTAAPTEMEIEDTAERRTPNGLKNLANDVIYHPLQTASIPSHDMPEPIPEYDPDVMEMDID
ncbi:hypothetical protein SCAR479_05821 [Seiridium cardinale]|uniref:Uncharacterized protein n=1 Tax=Seiridium cardinale TaxID=138064 RepID=A0ABR2XUE7_9PEZI